MKSLVTSHYFCYLHRYVLSLNVENIWRSKAVSTHFPLQPQFSPYNPTTPHPNPYLTKHVNHLCILFVLLTPHFRLRFAKGSRSQYVSVRGTHQRAAAARHDRLLSLSSLGRLVAFVACAAAVACKAAARPLPYTTAPAAADS